MKRTTTASLLALLCLAAPAGAADRRDGPAASADPAADIGDLYAWSDSAKVYLILTVFPSATQSSTFSTKVHYVLHTASRQTVAAATATPLDVICSFDAAQRVSCWAGADPADYVTGDGRGGAGLRSGSGRLRVFAGLRRDPFFFNQEGFQAFVDRVRAAAPTLTVDTANCPALSAAQAKSWRDALAQDRAGKPGKNTYEGTGTLALVLEVDRALMTKGGPIVSVYAATHARPN